MYFKIIEGKSGQVKEEGEHSGLEKQNIQFQTGLPKKKRAEEEEAHHDGTGRTKPESQVGIGGRGSYLFFDISSIYDFNS